MLIRNFLTCKATSRRAEKVLRRNLISLYPTRMSLYSTGYRITESPLDARHNVEMSLCLRNEVVRRTSSVKKVNIKCVLFKGES